LLAPFNANPWTFALLSDERAIQAPEVRIAELEVRLRRTGAEVKAAGILDNLVAVTTPIDVGGCRT
jgi:hypothetical protein